MKIRDLLAHVESGKLRALLSEIYGPEYADYQASRYRRLILRARELFGADADVVVSRAPGRINLMGRHVDYMGGYVNPLATNYDIISLLERRDDDTVELYNMDPLYEPGRFKISEELPKEKIASLSEWDRWTVQRAKEVERRGEGFRWIDYVKGLFVYLQINLSDIGVELDGFNILVDGEIPPRMGMSSSSALVVSVALALREVYDIGIPLGEFIDIIGYSEWYRLTRGGTADHAAIILSKRGYVSHIRCLPTRAEDVEYAPFPPGYSLILADSGVRRPHTEEAFNLLRATAASYRIGVLILKSLYSRYADRIGLLRDFNVRNLGISLAQLYRMLKGIPERASRSDIKRLVSEEYSEELETIFSNHREPAGGYRLRQNVLFGIAENERAYVFPKMLREGDIGNILRLIEVSHDGDRVVKFDENMERLPWDPSLFSSDEELDNYIHMLERSEDPTALERLQLHWMPGGYERSIENIDFMVDYVLHNFRGKAAGQLVGAGLGGGVLILAREDVAERLEEELRDSYHSRYGIKATFTKIAPGRGAEIMFR